MKGPVSDVRASLIERAGKAVVMSSFREKKERR